jgi:L-iditol 2-dehydrogenase
LSIGGGEIMIPKMRAIVYLGPEKIELREIPIPAPGEGELLVRIRAATTCGTDVKTYRRGHPKFPPPFVFGHEFGGDVVRVGKGVEFFREGMRVTANVFAECGACFYCKRGQGNICENLVYNFGAFAEYMIIPISIVKGNTFEIPSRIPYAEAALLEPLVTVVHGWRRVDIQPGERVAIIGAGGPISLMYLQLAQRSKASQIMAIGHSPKRLEVARILGATSILNSKDTEVVPWIRELTDGYGADVIIECAGTKETWEMSVNAARKGGRVLWFGGLPGGTKVEIDATQVHYGEITLLNVHGGTNADAREAFDLIVSGALRIAPMLSEAFPLEAVESALKSMIAGEVVKVVIDPQM